MANSFQNEQEHHELELLSELAENVVYKLPGCADVMIRKTIQEVYREFCRETQCFTSLCEFDICRDKKYTVGPRYGGLVHSIRCVNLEGRNLIVGADYTVFNAANSKVIVLNPSFVENEPKTEHINPDGAILSYSPIAEHSHYHPKKMVVQFVEMPSLNSEYVPSWFVNRFGDAICSGVLGRLCSMDGKPWTNAQIASDERIRYDNFKSEARIENELPIDGRFVDTSMTL